MVPFIKVVNGVFGQPYVDIIFIWGGNVSLFIFT